MTSPSTARKPNGALSSNPAEDFLTVMIAEQTFGIPVLQVHDVLGNQKVTRIPLAPPEVSGALNLRGRIVTAVEVRRCLGLEPQPQGSRSMSVVVGHNDELYSLIIDKVGDVLSLRSHDLVANPPTLEPAWRDVSLGIYRLDGELLVILDVPKLLGRIDCSRG